MPDLIRLQGLHVAITGARWIGAAGAERLPPEVSRVTVGSTFDLRKHAAEPPNASIRSSRNTR